MITFGFQVLHGCIDYPCLTPRNLGTITAAIHAAHAVAGRRKSYVDTPQPAFAKPSGDIPAVPVANNSKRTYYLDLEAAS